MPFPHASICIQMIGRANEAVFRGREAASIRYPFLFIHSFVGEGAWIFRSIRRLPDGVLLQVEELHSPALQAALDTASISRVDCTHTFRDYMCGKLIDFIHIKPLHVHFFRQWCQNNQVLYSLVSLIFSAVRITNSWANFFYAIRQTLRLKVTFSAAKNPSSTSLSAD